MFVGTASDAGKSFIATGFCRLLKNKGFTPAPFKAQNMSLNSFATPDGFEIGRAQAVQAQAASLAPHRDMNPILLKPSGKNKSQVVLNGKPLENDTTAREYFSSAKHFLFDAVKLSFDRLQKKYNPIIIEGAGSISELNLKHRDITNMRMARYAGADVYLVADIDKGGVFASVYGTIALLENWERRLIKGIIINKFRGDVVLFQEGKEKIEALTQKKIVGILPYNTDIYIEEEDSLILSKKARTASKETTKINIVVVRLPHLSNYTDFTALEKDSRVLLYYSDCPEEIALAKIIILPGTKNTIADLDFIRKKGIAQIILRAGGKGVKIVGICGGYQMLGKTIADPFKIEGNISKTIGLGIFPMHTVLKKGKKTVQSNFIFEGVAGKGYEIHCGDTDFSNGVTHLLTINGKAEGAKNNNYWGTYIHGFLDNASVINALLEPFTTQKNNL